MDADALRNRLDAVGRRIRAAERGAGRVENSVSLIAVSKLHPSQAIRELAGLGQRRFAENFVQEALRKQRELSDIDIEWHFIGRIQSNKTREIATTFSWVHSVDRLRIARRLSDQRDADAPPLNICIQINAQSEQSKGGVSPGDAAELIDEADRLPGISVRGLMIIPEPTDDSEAQHRIFAQMRSLLESLNRQGRSLDTLSMGMTGDMEAAIAEGSTHVRIGTALFGPRPKRVDS